MRLNIKKIMKKGIATAAAIVILASQVIAAPAYNDVPNTHWAYSAISRVVNKGYMLGDASGNFNPNNPIDKFEVSKILAMASGYKYTNITVAEQTTYDNAFNKNKAFLDLYVNKFAKWNSTANKEIAYLLEKGILTTSDLDQFVIKNENGSESIRALSRQEAAVLLVKLMGKASAALSSNYNYDFKDDSAISVTSRPYVYYLRSQGVIAGDTEGYFNPNIGVTRASLAVMLDKTLAIMDPYGYGTAVSTPVPSATASPSETISTITGTIDKFFLTMNAIQIKPSSEVNPKIYKMTDDIKIYVDGYIRVVSDLKEGMYIVGAVRNGSELTEIRGQSSSASIPTPVPTQNVTVPTSSAEILTREGTVKDVSVQSRTVSIEIRWLNPRGEVMPETRAYTMANTCEITIGDSIAALSDVYIGAVVTARISGSTLYSLKLEEKNRRINDGKLVEKKYIDTTGTPILVIEDSKGKSYELRVNASTYINRRDFGKVNWNDLRVGDSIEASAEYDVLTEVYAYGVRSSVDGWVEEIHITRNGSYIYMKGTDNIISKYNLILGTADAYSLRVGSKVRLRLDSMEVETIAVLEDASTIYLSGYIQSLKSGYFVLSDTSTTYSSTKNIKLDNNTIILDSKTGNRVSYSNLYEGNKVYVVLTSSSSDLARTIVILSAY